MCGRYTLTQTEKVKVRFNTLNTLDNFKPSYNVAPGQILPVITRNSPNKIIMMRWGFVPEWGKEKNFSMINIRRDTLLTKPYFKKILLTKRCIIPSTGFYEWKRVNLEGKEEKYPFYIHLTDQELCGFAGVYNTLEDAEGKKHESFAIITCDPNENVKKIHNRMPVILLKTDEEAWLNPETESIDALGNILKPYPKDKIKYYPVSKEVNSTRNDNSRLIEKISYPAFDAV